MVFSLYLVSVTLATILTIDGIRAEYDVQKSKEAAMKIMNECKTEVKGSDADVKALIEKKLPETHEGLCLIECMFSRAKMMKDGKFDKDGAIEMSTPALNGDKDKLEKVKTMMEECDKEIAGDADKCIVAKQIVECIEKKGKSFGFKYPGQQ